MENREELLEALRTIQNVCKKNQFCDTCPLSKNESCVLKEQDPVDWKIRVATTWKALED